MSLWTDIVDIVESPFKLAGEAISSAWHSIKDNPIGAITSAVAMAYGIPPAWAGALGGAAGAAATGGNIVKAAITGGAMGYMGQAAGAYAGSAGAIAQAAASGAAAGATGAILTGQDVLTAAKQGLILGTVIGGGQTAYKLMTAQEAMAEVQPDQLAKIYASGQDPLGDLIKEQGWVDSDSARAAASQAFSKNAATTMQQLTDSVPDNVLKEAYDYTKVHGGDQNAYIADKMGWNLNGHTATAIQNAYNDYVVASTQAKTAPQEPTNSGNLKNQGAVSGPSGTSTVQQIQDTGLVDASDAEVLHNAGYTANDVKNLVKLGYTGTDLADMASTGVSANTLTSLANSPYTEAQINNLLTNNVSATEVATAGNLISNGKMSMDQATQLIENGVKAGDLYSYGMSGQTQQVVNALNHGLSADAVSRIVGSDWDLSKVNSAIDSGKVSAQTLNSVPAGQNYYDILHTATTTPTTATTQPTKFNTMAEAQAAQAEAGGGGTITKSGGQYTYTPAQPVAPTTTSTLADIRTAAQNSYNEAYNEYLANGKQGTLTSTVDSHGNKFYTYNSPEPVTPVAPVETTTPTHVAAPAEPTYTAPTLPQGIPQGSIQISLPNGDLGYFDSATSTVYNSNGTEYTGTTMPASNTGTQVAQADTGTTTDVPYRVDVSGGAGFADNPSEAIPEYRTPNTDLATQAQIDNGTAKFNSAANAWEVPTATATSQPIVPVIVPPTTTTPATTPTNVTGPVTPTPTTPTIVSSSTRTTYDGSVYRDDQKSDGTVSSVLISGPTTGGPETGTGGTTGTTTPPPLSEPKQEVIPPGSSYVAPVETVTPEPSPAPTDGTTTPTDTTPIVPIVVPTDKTPTEDTTYGHFTIGAPIIPNVPHTLNPGWITNVPTHYATTNPAQAQYYWGAHPYQTGTTFDPTLYNNIPNAPATPWGQGYAQTAATPQQILQSMQGIYPLLTAAGPVAP